MYSASGNLHSSIEGSGMFLAWCVYITYEHSVTNRTSNRSIVGRDSKLHGATISTDSRRTTHGDLAFLEHDL